MTAFAGLRPSISAARRAELEANWHPLRRSIPKPGVPNASPPWVNRIVPSLMWIPYIPLTILAVPYYTIKHYLIPSWPAWTWGRMIRNRLNKLWIEIMPWFQVDSMEVDGTIRPEATRAAYAEAEQKGELKVVSLTLAPVEGEFRTGIASCPGVKAVPVVAFWLTPAGSAGEQNEPAKEGETVVLHIHGGGYLRGHPLWNVLPSNIAKASGVRILSKCTPVRTSLTTGINYRKPLIAETAFPAPLLDVLAGYLHLVNNLHFDPADICIMGKSAGGHLTFMLSRYLSDLDLPQPGSMALMAPWCDFEMGTPSYSTNAQFDTLVVSRLRKAVKSSLRWYQDEVISNPYFSPYDAKASDWAYLAEAGTQVYMMVGTKEMFQDEIERVAKRMKEAGVAVQLREDVNGLHTSALVDPRAMSVFVKDVCELLQ